MPLSAGTPREWLRPVEQGENNTRGDHRGPSEALNVRHAQAGWTYYYLRNNPNHVQRFLNEGWIPVRGEDPEEWGAQLPEDIQSALGTMKPYKDVFLFKIRNDVYAEMKKEKLETAERARVGAEQSYFSQGEARALQLGRSAPSNELYYQRPQHITD